MDPVETAKALFFEGLDLIAREQFIAAEEKFLAVLQIVPDRVSALTNLAATQIKLGKLAEARRHLGRVIELEPDSVDGWMNFGMLEAEEGNVEAAIAAMERVVGLNPDHPMAWPMLAGWHDQRGEFRSAVNCYINALRISPGEFQWLSNVGAILNDLREFEQALEYHDRSLKLNPRQPGTLSNKGNSLHELRRYDEALAAHEQALILDPQFAEGWSNKANTLRAMRLHDEALAGYDRAIRLKPDYVGAWCGKGVALRELKRFDEALAQFDRALTLRPDDGDALVGKALALHELRRFEEALALYERALQLQSEFAEGWSGKGVTLHELNRHDDALAAFGRALALRPDLDFQLGQLLHAKMKLCDWAGLDELLGQLFRGVRGGKPVSAPFHVLALGDSEELNLRSAQAWVQARYPVQPQATSAGGTPGQQRIRIGYYSADFHNHAAAYLTAEMFERHDRSRFEIIAFSFGPDRNDEMRQRIAKTMDRFIDVRDKSDREVAELSRTMGIDIAVDLKGHTEDSRLGLFAYRAAPVQVTYLGYPGTTGAAYMVIADPVVIPERNRQWFSEKIAYLPDCYQVNDSTRKTGGAVPSRQSLGLTQTGFVFCCFNNNYKITPATFDGWMRILYAVEGSVLWLVDDNAAVVRNLRAEAVRRGVAGERLVFAKRTDYATHLARHRAADLFLDTLPYNAHTTASDALLAGLPVLTCIGATFPGRVAASLLRAVGLPQLITENAAAYEAMAIELARNPAALQEVKQQLAANLPGAPLFNTPQMTRQIESAYQAMHERRRCGLPPDHLFIERIP